MGQALPQGALSGGVGCGGDAGAVSGLTGKFLPTSEFAHRKAPHTGLLKRSYWGLRCATVRGTSLKGHNG